jgi:hypothetical protein
VLVASVAAAGEAIRGRFGRLSSVVSDVPSAAAVTCSSCRRFFADLSSLVFFVLATFDVLAIFSVDIVCMCSCVVVRQLGYYCCLSREKNKKQISMQLKSPASHASDSFCPCTPSVKASLSPPDCVSLRGTCTRRIYSPSRTIHHTRNSCSD